MKKTRIIDTKHTKKNNQKDFRYTVIAVNQKWFKGKANQIIKQSGIQNLNINRYASNGFTVKM